MTYGSWDMEHNREDFLSFWTIFCPLTPLTRKIKILKKWKSPPWDIIILHKCAKNHDHTCYTVLEIWCVADIIFIFHFRLFLPSYPCNNPKEFQNFKKMKKKTRRYHHFTHVYQKSWSHDVWFLRIVVHGWMDKWIK